MKCDECFFCVYIGKGVYADFPIKYCKHKNEYKLPFVWGKENDVLSQRPLDFNNMKDCKIWREVGCGIHHSTVEKAKRDFLASIMEEDGE